MLLAAAAASSATLRVSSDEEAIAKRGRVYAAHQVLAGWNYLQRRLPASDDRTI
ncbi:hypothetical protein [Nocardia abscessus]|uniref:hypothetical protein n=1 Tax=Nocardia abscessus TaxID=120957 RepID=UPI002455E2ED|nr:hypothetical protein [Nocardia abscessus]